MNIPNDLAKVLSVRENEALRCVMIGMKHKEIGAILGVTESTASQFYHRAKIKANDLGYDFQIRVMVK